MSLADALAPAEHTVVTVDLPIPRGQVSLPVYARSETRWKGALPTGFSSVPNKEALDLDGAPVYPELLIVHLLECRVAQELGRDRVLACHSRPHHSTAPPARHPGAGQPAGGPRHALGHHRLAWARTAPARMPDR